MHYTARDEIFGVLRDAYDGKTEKIFGTGIKRSYESKFGILAGVTPKIESFSIMHQSLGERFLKFRICGSSEDNESETEKIRKALANINHEHEMKNELKKTALKVLNKPLPSSLPKIKDKIKEQVIYLAQFCAALRGVVERDRFTQNVIYKPTTEVGTRLGKQLMKLGIGIAMYLDSNRVGSDEYNLIKQVALDTCPDKIEEIVRQIWMGCKHSDDSLKSSDISKRTRLPQATCFRTLQDLELLRIVDRIGSGTKYEWKLTTRLRHLIEKGKLYE